MDGSFEQPLTQRLCLLWSLNLGPMFCGAIKRDGEPSRQWDRRGARPASEWGRPSPGLVLPVGLLCQDVDLRDWQLGFATQFAHGVAGGQA